MFDFISNFNLKLSSTQEEFSGVSYMSVGINVKCLLFLYCLNHICFSAEEKVKISLYTTGGHVRVELQLHSFVTEHSFDRDECSVYPVAYPRGRNSRYPLNRRVGMPSSRSGGFEKEKNLAFARNRTPDRLASSPNLTKILPAGTELFRAGGRTDMARLFTAYQTGLKTDHRSVKLLI